jgi:cellulose synthase/poly-beta-1,6-N-acetylglucosamine synthase-like glycosyltransferase
MSAVIVLAAAAVVVAYILLGYPMLLAFAPVQAGPAVTKDPAFRPRVSIIIAVYNGGAFLRRKLESILSFEYPPQLMEILVVSDGSTDNSDNIAGEFAANGVHLLKQPHAGKATAINAALTVANGEILFFRMCASAWTRLPWLT